MRSSARCTSSMRSAGPAKITVCSPTTDAAAQRRKADVAGAARAGLAVAAARRALVEIDAAALRRRAAEHQRGAGRRVDLLVVVHLEDLDVEVLVERLRHALDQRRQQIDAQAHVAGLDDHRALAPPPRSASRPRRVSPVVPMTCTSPCRAASSAKATVAAGMVKSIRPSACASSGATSVATRDAVLAQPRELAGVAADHGRARRLDRARERRAVHRRDGLDQRAPHAPAGAGHDQPHVGHRFAPELAGGI